MLTLLALVSVVIAGCLTTADGGLAETQPTHADAAHADAANELAALCPDDCPPELRARLVQAYLDEERYTDALPHLQILVRAGAPCDSIRLDAQEDLLWVRSMQRDRDAVAATARTIAEDCPTAPVAAQAWMLVGERAFEDAQLDLAAAAYRRAVAVEQGRDGVRAYAWYKLAWVLFNVQDFAAAEHAFGQAWTLAAREDPDSLLAREARRDVVRTWLPRDLDAATAAARIRTIARTPDEATRLATSYEQLLRDVALDPRADAFARAWSDTGPGSVSPDRPTSGQSSDTEPGSVSSVADSP